MALGGQSSRSDDHDPDSEGAIFSEINITPLTDIFLVLLIIFMVTSSVISQMGVDVSLPKASSKTTSAQPEGVVVTLMPDGGLRVNGDAIPSGDYAKLQARLVEAFKTSKEKLVILEGDKKALLGNAVEVMDYSRRAGAERFAVATNPEGK